MSVSLQPRQQAALQVELNAAFLGALQAALAQARDQGLIEGRLTPGDLLRLPQALSIREGSASAEPLPASFLDAVERAVDGALTDLDRMRTHEGRSFEPISPCGMRFSRR